jgi:hypothetical protein
MVGCQLYSGITTGNFSTFFAVAQRELTGTPEEAPGDVRPFGRLVAAPVYGASPPAANGDLRRRAVKREITGMPYDANGDVRPLWVVLPGAVLR